MNNPFKLTGYEKFWGVIFSGGMSTAVITLTLWGLSGLTNKIPEMTSEAVVAGITGVIITLFNAANVFITANTSEEVGSPHDEIN